MGLKSKPKVARRSHSSVAATADPAQMVIDAGQRRVAGESEMCKSCRFLYAKGDADEERLHDAAHKKYLGVVSFAGRIAHGELSGWMLSHLLELLGFIGD